MILFTCWASASLSQLDKYLSLLRTAGLLAIGFAGILVGVLALGSIYGGHTRDLPRWSLGVIWLIVAAAILVIYPISARHAGGGDREDALRVEIAVILHGQPPYMARTFNGNPATPLPGSLLLASPFFAVNRIYLQNLLWTGLLAWFAGSFFRWRATAAFLLLVFVLLSPGDLDDLAVGGDFFINVLYVILALLLAASSYEQERLARFRWLLLAFLGVALSSRPIYVVSLPLLFSFVLQRQGGLAAWKAVGLVSLVAAAVTLPFYLHDPSKLLPQHLTGRASLLLPPWLHPALFLPLAGMLVALSSLRVRLRPANLLLFFGLAMSAMLLPPLLPAFLVPFRGYPPGTNIGVLDLVYLAPAVFPLALWAMKRYECAVSVPSTISGKSLGSDASAAAKASATEQVNP